MTRPLSVALLLLPRFTLAPFALLQDVLRLSADEGDRSRPLRLTWTVLSAGGGPVVSSSGIGVSAGAALRDPSRYDYIVVCGGLLERGRRDDSEVEAWLREAQRLRVVVAGLCTGSFMLAQAGLLDGRRACVSWFHAADFEREFPGITTVSTHRLVVDGNVATCAGGAGAADLGAWIVGRHLGTAVARKALDILMIDSQDGLQPRPAMADGMRDVRLRRVVLLMEERMDRPPDLDDLARRVAMSRRQLERLFKSDTGRGPASFVAAMRLRYADWMMRTTDRSMTQIALACGFADLAHLSRKYSAAYGMPPSKARLLGGFEGGERRPYGNPVADCPLNRLELSRHERTHSMPIDDYDRIIAERSIRVEWFAHPPVATVDEARTYWAAIDAVHTKNLLLKDEGRRFWLVVLPAEARLDLKTLPSAIGSRRLRFASADDLERLLGVPTGAVSPLALVNDTEGQVTLAIAADLLKSDRLAFHPLRNDATITISPADFGRYLREVGHEPVLFVLP